MASNGPKFRQEIQQMMYVAGESQETSVETTFLVEEIIRDQVVLMLTVANHLAARRGSRVFSNNDLIFQFRHDAARVGRLCNFLAWKGVRKATKESEDDKADLTTAEEPASFDDLAGVSSEGAREAKVPIVLLPWDISSFFPDEIPDHIFEDQTPNESNEAALEKLRKADDKTRGMTAEEYATWSEYRHASFTWRKVKRFREWAGLGVIGDHKPNDDVLDVLGFLTCEMVQKLTEVALEIQAQDMTRARRDSDVPSAPTAEALGSEGLFSSPRRLRQPIECRHVRLAFETLQVPPKRSRALLNGTRLPQRNDLRLVCFAKGCAGAVVFAD